jgi:type II secretory pathway predicted ATPase ExeA
MYNEFYGFSQKPFEVAPDPKFLYFTSSHWGALDAMTTGIKTRQGFISITGEVGTGKTTLIHSLSSSLAKRVKTAFIFHTLITFEELLGSILRELSLEVTGKDKRTLLHQLVEYLLHIGNDETVAVIIDEAQHLSTETLQELGELPHLIPLASERLQIVFVGQPEFKNILNSPSLKILNQRIRIRREITNMTAEESRDYIEHHLKIVGSSTSDTFTPQAVSVITTYAKGIPRVINIVCDNAFFGGFSESKKKIDAKIIREVINNLEGPSRLQFKPMKASSYQKKYFNSHNRILWLESMLYKQEGNTEEVIMSQIQTKHLLFDVPDVMEGVTGFNVYYCPKTSGPVTYVTPYKFFPVVAGQVTYDIAPPTDLPVTEGDWTLGAATVDANGNFSDIVTIEASFRFTPPMPPKNLRVS